MTAITLNGVTLVGITDISDDEVFLDVHINSYSGRYRRNYVSRTMRGFRLHWIGLTAAEVTTLKTLANLATKNILIFTHPTETVSGLPAEFPVILNPRSSGLQIDYMQAWDTDGNGPLLYEVTMLLVTQRIESNAAFSAVRYPQY